MNDTLTGVIVDDDASVLRGLGRVLTSVGVESVPCQSAGEALASLQVNRDRIGFALVDILMPQTSGLELLALLRRDYPDLPVVMMTGEPDTSRVVDSIRGGALDVLEKPFSKEALLAAIEKCRRAAKRPAARAPLNELMRLAAADATGELICVGDSLECHVYLQNGRIAWATLSSKPLEFVHYLQTHCRLDMEAFRAALDDARKNGRPVGETLVAWQLVTWADVRSALQHQVSQAIAAIDATNSAMFLQRKEFKEYNPELTFAISDVLPVAPKAVAETKTAERPRLTAKQLLDAASALRWVEIFEDGVCVDTAVNGKRFGKMEPALQSLVLDRDASLGAVRTPGGGLIGVRWDDARVAWCWLSNDGAYGQSVATLCSLRALSRSASAENARNEGCAAWSSGAGSLAESLLAYDVNIVGAILLDAAGQQIQGAGRGVVSPSACMTLAERGAKALAAELPEPTIEPVSHAAGATARSTVARYDDRWCFGGEVPGHAVTVWLILDGRAPQGLGWACLTSALRAAARQLNGAER